MAVNIFVRIISICSSWTFLSSILENCFEGETIKSYKRKDWLLLYLVSLFIASNINFHRHSRTAHHSRYNKAKNSHNMSWMKRDDDEENDENESARFFFHSVDKGKSMIYMRWFFSKKSKYYRFPSILHFNLHSLFRVFSALVWPFSLPF